VIDNFQNPAQVIHGLKNDPMLQKLLAGVPLAGFQFRGLRVEGIFTPESEITLNAEKYNDYRFACIVLVNEIFHAVGQMKDVSDSIILPEIDHSVIYDGKVIFAGIA
jgi:hypothetical protein